MIKTNWLEVQSLYVYAEGARAWTCFPVYAGLLSGMAFALAPSTIPVSQSNAGGVRLAGAKCVTLGSYQSQCGFQTNARRRLGAQHDHLTRRSRHFVPS